MTRFLLVLTVALALAPAAFADGPPLASVQGGAGVLAAGGVYSSVAVGTEDRQATILERIATRDGSVDATQSLLGAWGIPVAAYSGATGEGLSTDGRTLVLGDLSYTFPHTHSGFALVDPKTLTVRDSFGLRGDFSFDALSPDGRMLYLIQHTNPNDTNHYVVRAYDTWRNRLVPGRIADREQRSWVMQGWPVDRVETAAGRWVYTLYDDPGGYPFVHALDTVRGVARCIGLPWRGKESGVYNLRLSLHDGGKALAVHWLSGRRWLVANTATWRLSPDRGGGFPWWSLALLAPLPLAPFALRRRDAAATKP
jgi:hypothetical protein